MKDMKAIFSTLWVFVTLNYIYCDVFRSFEGSEAAFRITQGLLLGASILMEIPMAMVLLSRILRYKANRWANVIAGGIMTVVQVLSLFVGTPALYYLFFSVVEVACTLAIIWYAWKWNNLKYDASEYA